MKKSEDLANAELVIALLGPIKHLGWSAGANLACSTIKTTNDMPIVARVNRVLPVIGLPEGDWLRCRANAHLRLGVFFGNATSARISPPLVKMHVLRCQPPFGDMMSPRASPNSRK